MNRRRACLAFVVGAVVAGTAGARADDNGDRSNNSAYWIGSWGAAPQQPVDPATGGTAMSFSDQTIRQIVRLSVGGGKLRVRLTNEYGAAPVTFDAVHIALTAANGAIVAGSDRALSFGGHTGVTLAPFGPALSDPVEFPVPGLTSVSISLHVPAGGNTGAATPHSLGVQTAYVAPGDRTSALTLPGASTTTVRFFISGVDLQADQSGATIVTLGDSITDGYASTVDANHRWPDRLAQRLQATRSLGRLGVVDVGISGNRVLSEGVGPNALSRLDRDVLARPGVRYVTLLEGINDIGFPNLPAAFGFQNLGTEPTADQIIAGYRQLIARTHEKGLLIYGGTLTPYKPSLYFTAAGETIRQTVNAFIRTSGEFDGVLDFDVATRDPANPSMFLPAYDSGDHLHPSDAGYAAMANSIDLRLFQSPYGDH